MKALRKTITPLAVAAALAALLLSACGGGGGGTSSITDAQSSTPVTTTATTAATDTAVVDPATTAAEVATLLATVTLDPLEVSIAKLAPAVSSRREALGQLIFNDANLSEPRGTACVNCHRPNMGFAGNNRSTVGVPLGSRGILGLRNAMTNAYSGFIPSFGFKTEDGNTEAIGGHFWDGRADTLALQALGPFLNPNEMNNANAKAVMDKIAVSSYANLFRQEFGTNVFANADTAYTQVGVAIEAFERTNRLQSFTSKYDAFVRGKVSLTPAEQRGMALFTDASKANCAGCHLMNPASGNPQDSLFSEFTYYATGIPRNVAIPSNKDASFFDLGLCGPNRAKPVLPATVPATVSIESFCGMFRMPTLRNVAERPAFMHNGVFKDLREVVRFYATRNSNPERWYGPSGVPNDLPTAYLGNIEKTKAPFNRTRADGPALTDAEVNDVVAFLGTLSDGFTVPAATPAPPPAPSAPPVPPAPPTPPAPRP